METQVPIVTSGLSKANYADNVNTLTTANNNLRQVQAGQTALGLAQSLGMTPEQFLAINPNFAATGNKGDFSGLSGLIKVGQTYKTAADVTPPTPNNTGGDGAKNGNTGSGGIQDTGDTKKTQNITTNYDGSKFATNNDGSTTLTYSDGTSFDIPQNMDLGLAKQGYDNIISLKKSAESTKLTLDNAAALMADDPAAKAAADYIKQQYDTLIQQMQDKNAMLMGSYAKNAARGGMLQYANEMNSNFMSQELDKAHQRVADLVAKQQKAIADSNAAYKSGNLKAFEAATKAYEQSLKDTNTAINTLQDNITAVVKQNAADIKTAETNARNEMLDGIKLATASAPDVAVQLSMEKDPKKQDLIIENASKELGVDVSILRSAVIKAQATMTKEDLANRRTEALLNKALNPNQPKQTQSEKEANAVDSFSNTFVPGATLKDGTPILDDNGYLTPIAWNIAIKNAPGNGLTRAKFIAAFADKVYRDESGGVPKAYRLTPLEVKKYITGVAPAE